MSLTHTPLSNKHQPTHFMTLAKTTMVLRGKTAAGRPPCKQPPLKWPKPCGGCQSVGHRRVEVVIQRLLLVTLNA
jgi:hypothetical protein